MYVMTAKGAALRSHTKADVRARLADCMNQACANERHAAVVNFKCSCFKYLRACCSLGVHRFWVVCVSARCQL